MPPTQGAAMRLLLDYAFTVLGLHSVMLTVVEYNHAGRRCYEKAGFREMGRRRESSTCRRGTSSRCSAASPAHCARPCGT